MWYFVIVIVGIGFYTDLAIGGSTFTGYSGGTGSKGTCASSCHGSGVGTITVSGLPPAYVPGTSYRVVVGHAGGAALSNFNASTRIGSTTMVAGTFTAVTNAALYSVSVESGVQASTTAVDSSVFTWKAPATGTGVVKFHLGGLQGAKGGANTSLDVTISESLRGIVSLPPVPQFRDILENYPNPFNPSTTLTFVAGARDYYTLKVFDVLGREIATLFDNRATAGASYTVPFDATGMASGSYVAVLKSATITSTKNLLLSR